MREGWTENSLGELAKFRRDRLDPLSLDSAHLLCHWSIPALDEFGGPLWEPAGKIGSHKFRVRENAVVFSLLNPRIPRFALVAGGDDVVCSTEFAVMQPTDLVHETFLFLLASSNIFQKVVGSLASGTTKSRERVKPSDLEDVSIILPPLNEQRRIVDVMSFFDAYIDALQQQADSARTARNAVLHELLSAGINDWTETTLGGVAVFYNGKAYKQDELLASGKYRVLRVGNFFSNGNWYWSDLELDANKYCDFGDLLYAWSASFGPRIWTDEKVIYHYHIWKVEEKPLQVEKKFLYYWLEDDVQRMKRDAGTGSIMMHITKGEIEARAIALPPLGEQKRIVEIVSSMDDVIQSTKQAVTDAKVLRSGLLSDLLSGEHEIPASYDSLLGVA